MSCNYMVPSIIEIVICYIMCGSSDGKLWMACVSSNCILGIMKGVLSHKKKALASNQTFMAPWQYWLQAKSDFSVT